MFADLTFAFHGARRARVFASPRAGHRGAGAPLLLLFDGQNIFDDAGSYAGGWQAHAAVGALPGTIEVPVVVAIDNGGHARIEELWRGLDGLLDAIRGDLLPTVRAGWAVRPGPVAIGGSSLGGLAALAAHFRHPDTFGAAICISPSFWFDNGAIFREVPVRPAAAARVYLDVGLRESPRMVAGAQRMVGHLQAHGYDATRLLWRPDARGTHRERHWQRRLPKALRFVFRR
jgi:enterochelin esterase-like enzyme